MYAFTVHRPEGLAKHGEFDGIIVPRLSQRVEEMYSRNPRLSAFHRLARAMRNPTFIDQVANTLRDEDCMLGNLRQPHQFSESAACKRPGNKQ